MKNNKKTSISQVAPVFPNQNKDGGHRLTREGRNLEFLKNLFKCLVDKLFILMTTTNTSGKSYGLLYFQASPFDAESSMASSVIEI